MRENPADRGQAAAAWPLQMIEERVEPARKAAACRLVADAYRIVEYHGPKGFEDALASAQRVIRHALQAVSDAPPDEIDHAAECGVGLLVFVRPRKGGIQVTATKYAAYHARRAVERVEETVNV